MSKAARQRAVVIGGISLLVIGILLGAGGRARARRASGPLGADPNDAGPTGLLGLTLLLERNDHDVERVAEAPSEDDLDAERRPPSSWLPAR